ncbi:MAG: GAF domain-containing protein [Hyphomicrobiaceae bacterium]
MPSPDEKQLTLACGQYGPLTSFADTSKQTSFALGEGLPGKAWEAGHPIVYHSLKRPAFVREEAAAEAGLTCGVAIPVIKDTKTIAVLVLFCGDDTEHVGAIEIWHAPLGFVDLKLFDGYFGTASRFEFQARHISFRSGFGLPGMTWQSNAPVIMDDLGRTKRFIRRDSAEQAGITRGLGLPVQSKLPGMWVLAFLSALGTPIADRFEIWQVVEDGSALAFQSGLCESGSDLNAAYSGLKIRADDTALGRMLQQGIPLLADDLEKEVSPVAESCATANLSRMVALPIYSGSQMTSVVTWYN